MKHTILILGALIALSAHATPGGESNNTGCKGKGNRNSPCKAPGAATASQARYSARVNASAASTAFVAPGAVVANPTAIATVAPGAVDMAGALIGNTVNANPRHAPSVSVSAPQQPLTSCRLGFGVGGSNAGGGLGLNIPMGSDITCLVGAKLTVMERVGGFSDTERRQVACELEGMEKLESCKRVAQAAPVVSRREFEAP